MVAGHQWTVFLAKRTPDMVGNSLLGRKTAQWVSGAALKPIAHATLPPRDTR